MILGIDYGRSKIGLATAEAGFAAPWKVVKVESWEEALIQVEQVVQVEQVEQVVVGVAESRMGEEQERFAQELGKRLTVSVVTQDETLSTLDAQQMAIEAGLGRKKRREKEDAFAAAVVLQSYLDGKASEGSGNV